MSGFNGSLEFKSGTQLGLLKNLIALKPKKNEHL